MIKKIDFMQYPRYELINMRNSLDSFHCSLYDMACKDCPLQSFCDYYFKTLKEVEKAIAQLDDYILQHGG